MEWQLDNSGLSFYTSRFSRFLLMWVDSVVEPERVITGSGCSVANCSEGKITDPSHLKLKCC